LHGDKLHGRWALVATRRGRSARQPQWLLIKAKDAAARSHDELNVVEQFPNSVDSGQSIDETAVSPPGKKGNKKATASAAKQGT
jgi:bifunctional non-homologous end joining protein LigD